MNKPLKYWVACSGGVDSVVLLHLICQLKKKKDVGVLHCNFNLRGDASNKDEMFVRKLAEMLHVPIRVKNFNTIQYGETHKINTQLAARELRYNWFDELIQKEKSTVLLAHHYDDQIETFFLQLRRGGKVKGLSGMPVFKSGYLRPLLKYTKKELLHLAEKNQWEWTEDSTNTSNDYTRNWYRNIVLPFLNEKEFPTTDIVPLVHSFQKVLAFLNSFPIPSSILIKEWLPLPKWFKEHLLFEHGLGMYSANEIDRLTKAEKGKYLGSESIKVWNEGEQLFFVKEEQLSKKYNLRTATLAKNKTKINSTDLFLDASKVVGQLSIRKWKSGDVFQPLGMKGEKSVTKFLRDRKVLTHQKESVYVLIDQNNSIVGIFGFGAGERFKIDKNTSQVIFAQLIEK